MEVIADSDEQLMQRFGRGEVAAFDELYQRHELRIWRYIKRSVQNHASAEELMQDVWFSVAREANRYRPTARFTTWLFTIARNRIVDVFRMNRDHGSLDEEGDGPANIAARLAGDASLEPPERVLRQQHASALLAAVERLPAEQREAFLLHVEGELTLEEIAAATGTSFETAKSRLRYARVKLRQLLQEYA
jgi:RNA polymerase sigma-70 factor (ECF subfamily)